MKRLIFRVTVALLTFTGGVVVTLWLTSDAERPRSEAREVQTPRAISERAEPFTLVGGMSARTLDSGCINSEIYRAADGSQLSYSRENYRSPAQAARELRREIKDAERVVEQLPMKDDSGRRIGERVVLLWRANTRSWARASVLWTRDDKSFGINAESLERALEFEATHQGKR